MVWEDLPPVRTEEALPQPLCSLPHVHTSAVIQLVGPCPLGGGGAVEVCPWEHVSLRQSQPASWLRAIRDPIILPSEIS